MKSQTGCLILRGDIGARDGRQTRIDHVSNNASLDYLCARFP
jgi:hypothetical protein